RSGVEDELIGTAALGWEDCAQRFVSADDFGEGAGQRAHVERARQPEGRREVIRRARGLPLFEEPQALLRERERDGRVYTSARDRLSLRAPLLPLRALAELLPQQLKLLRR